MAVQDLLSALSEYPVLQLQVEVPGPVFVQICAQPPFENAQFTIVQLAPDAVYPELHPQCD